MQTLTEIVRALSERYPKVQNLMRYVTVKSLKLAHQNADGKKAKGIDGVTKEEYEKNLEENLENLIKRMKDFSYRPQPVRRVYIPKANGKLRPLGIPAYEEKLVQAVMSDVLQGIYEPRFLDCSYGFRPGRDCHDVVRLIDKTLMRENANFVLEADIKGFFDNVSHEWMMKFLENDIDDQVFLRYINRFLKAGVMEEGKLFEVDKGTPQGGLISPVLANVYLHYALDMWIEKSVMSKLKGWAKYVRYADDFLMVFQYEEDAVNVMNALPGRLGKFNLEVAPEKTRVLPFGRNDRDNNSFDFLGFTFYEAKTRKGGFRVGIKTSSKKLKQKRKALKQWAKEHMHDPVANTLKRLDQKLRGHCQYYGVNGNFVSLKNFYYYARYTMLKVLRRRGQRHRMTWAKMNELWHMYISRPTIMVQIWY
jgi:group II intron reverse transcriptase/maturase